MSTKSRIAMKQNDGTYKSIYCHHDGYLTGVGRTLYKNYRDPIKVELMINLGDLECLKEYIYPDTSRIHNFDNPQCDVCVSYHRDRGESFNYTIFQNKDDLIEYTCKTDQEYLYIFENDNWQVANTNSKTPDEIVFEKLESKLYENDIIESLDNSFDEYTEELANGLVRYAKDFDPYDFNDCYDSEYEASVIIKKDLDRGRGIDDYIRILCENIENNAIEDDLSNHEIKRLNDMAFGLMYELNQYKKVLDNNLDKEMDM